TFSNYFLDADGDGFGADTAAPLSACRPVAGRVTTAGDCDDSSAAVRPGAAETCNDVDDDCDGIRDDGLSYAQYYPDSDGDGFGALSGAPVSSCAAIPGRVANGTDCNDLNVDVRPGAAEACNGVDDDCNGQVDEGLSFSDYFVDVDGDGRGAAGSAALSSCAPVQGRVTSSDDCDDSRVSVRPGAAEACNGADDDCDGQVDEAVTTSTWYADADGDGHGAPGTGVQACAAPSGRVQSQDDCDDTRASVKPGAPEQCNGLDDDCNGQVDDSVQYADWFPDLDGDGFGAAGAQPENACSKPAGKVANAQDCDDARTTVHPNAAEACNAADDDCDGQVDEGLSLIGYYPDLDSDGYGSAAAQPQASCAPVPGKVSTATDCDDANAAVHPGRAETCNGVDDDCSGAADEGLPTQAWYVDLDGDGYGAASGVGQDSCMAVAGRVANAQDCDDSKSTVKPGAAEACNGADDDCDGALDEGNPGGGAACDTGQFGVCSAGTRTCQAGALACVRNVTPNAESCDGLDNDCDGSVDETFTNKGQACTAGLGVCARTGSYVCAAGGQATTCSATAGAPTAAACDGLDNDCDGVVDDPAFTGTLDAHATAWTDLEVVPYYYLADSPAYGCNGGLTNTTGGSDTQAGGWLVMAGATYGIQVRKLDNTGAPTGSPVSISSYTYPDVAAAQSGDGVVVVGVWGDNELDFYYFDGATGVKRAYSGGQFKRSSSTYKLDSLRVVRGSSGKVTVVWRDSQVGLRLAQVKPASVNGAWTFQNGTGGALSSTVLVSNSAVKAGVGADSNVQDWVTSQSCAPLTSQRTLGISYVAPVAGSSPAQHSVRRFTVKEDGTGKSTETQLAVLQTSDGTLGEPEVVFYRYASADHWLTAYTESNTTYSPAVEDLLFEMTSAPGWNYAWVEMASENGADSIQRPRVSFSGSEFWMTGLRYVADGSAFKRQVMTRKVDLAGVKNPAGTATELPATAGACPAGVTDCRPGSKAGLVTWAAKGRVYYSGSGATPSGTYAGTLSCQ
ncbi:MAG: putative metal-binding motif-containing protein, partial [Deltaproteobacteria bacterium]|nr:putative metal-binding motif-containing protein [Deltaproteobacteria bacterium]